MKPRVLLVDDNHHLRVTLADHLSHDGFDVTTAESGEHALELIATNEPDLIILDINMPGMGGLGFLRSIMDENGQPKHPVLVLTARSSMDKFFGTVPVDGFLAKPCPMSELLDRMRSILKKRGIRSQAEQTDCISEEARTLTLIAEDDDDIRDRLIRAFEQAEYEVCVAKTGPAVMEIAPVLLPRLIVMKQLLPRMNGNIVAPMVAQMPCMKGVMIILYDESRKYEDPQSFVKLMPPCVTRYLASNRAYELVQAANTLTRRGAKSGRGGHSAAS